MSAEPRRTDGAARATGVVPRPDPSAVSTRKGRVVHTVASDGKDRDGYGGREHARPGREKARQ